MNREEFEFTPGEEESPEIGLDKAELDPLAKPKEEWETEDEEGFIEPQEDFSSDFLPAEEGE